MHMNGWSESAHPNKKRRIEQSNNEHVRTALERQMQRFYDDNEHWTRVELTRARHAIKRPASDTMSSSITSFRSLKPVAFAPVSKETSAKNSHLRSVWRMEGAKHGGKPVKKVLMARQQKLSSPDALQIPTYAHYVSIRTNLLAPNVTTLHCWPYFGDDDEENPRIGDALREHYTFAPHAWETGITWQLKSLQYMEYMECALQDIGCTWADVLIYYLDATPTMNLGLDARDALPSQYDQTDPSFSKKAKKWIQVRQSLPPSSPERMARVSTLCGIFSNMANFSLWQIAKQSKYCTIIATKPKSPGHNSDMTCSICLRFDCPYHGEMRETQLDDDNSDSESGDTAAEAAVRTDVANPLNCNHRLFVEFPSETTTLMESGGSVGSRNAQFWSSTNFAKTNEQSLFYPCDHPGASCESSACSCFRNKTPCEKICGCGVQCTRKFRGCSCHARSGGRAACAEDLNCACFQSSRECDPDLCWSCGVSDVVDPVNQGADTAPVIRGRCGFANIQRGKGKLTLLGDSSIHGLGLYAGEDIRENDFVGEYVGEIIQKEEADRRGAIYELRSMSYLFSLSASQELDATHFGNKTRFINHAPGINANVRARIILVNTVHRIGLYAERMIRAGEELFFDYGPSFPDEQLGGKNPRKSIPHARNTKLVEEFYDVSEYKDELGNKRACKIPGSGSKSKRTITSPPRTNRAGIIQQSTLQIGVAEDEDFMPDGTDSSVSISDEESDDSSAILPGRRRLAKSIFRTQE